MSLCDRCKDPGMCCREITLNHDFAGLHPLDALVWMATVQPAQGELGLPFLPISRIPRALAFGLERFGEYPCPLDEVWVFTCPVVTEDGRCGDYENRPKLCQTFLPGQHIPCVMFYPFEQGMCRKEVVLQ